MTVTAAVKACTKCGEVKSLDEFYMNRDYLRGECKGCHRAAMRALWQIHRERMGVGSFREWRRKEVARWRERSLVASWGARCPICSSQPNMRSEVDGGWLVYCCALYWTITDQQLMEAL